MRKRILATCAAASLGLSVGLAISGTAAANHSPPHLHDPVESGCGVTTFQADLPAEEHGSYANARLVVDDGSEVHVAELGEPITVGPFTEETVKIHYRVFGGGERNYDVPLWDGHEDGPGDWRDSINAYGAEHGWEWTLAGVEDENPFVQWEKVTVEGCPPAGPTVESMVAVSCDLLVMAIRNIDEPTGIHFGLVTETETVHGSVADAEQILALDHTLELAEGAVATLPDNVSLTDSQALAAGEIAGPDEPVAVGEVRAHGMAISEGAEVLVFAGIVGDDGAVGGRMITWDEITAALDCPGDEDTVDTVVDDGATDELAATGSPTLWIAGTAVALLVIGGGLYFLTRRRGVDFTA